MEVCDIASLFVQDPGLALVCIDGNVSPPTTSLQKVKKWSGDSVGKQHFFFLSVIFLNEPIAGTPRHAHRTFLENITWYMSWLRRAIVSTE